MKPKPVYLEKGWRIGVGIVLLNNDKNIFLGKRIDNKGAWQMPQGGVNVGSGEELYVAAKRELYEETGVTSVTFLGESKEWYYYYLPKYLSSKLWKGKFIGQKQKWFALNFEGKDSEINISSHKSPEFCNWDWVNPEHAINKIIDFKKDIYKKIFEEFSCFI